MIIDEMIISINRDQWKKYVVGIALVAAVVLAGLAITKVVHGYDGSSGPANGSAPACGGRWARDNQYHNSWPNSNCGTAWIKYPASGTSTPFPSGFSNGTSWSSVVSKCSTAGSIVVFVYFSANGTAGRPEESYDYSPDVSYSYNRWAAAGYAYKSLADAQTDFNNTPSNQRSGNTWGSNVGWFCYSDNWTLSLTTTADKTVAEPGERITWTHVLKNDGPAATNQAIAWRYKNQGDISGQGSPDWSWISGQAKDMSSPQTSTYDVGVGDIGKTLCRSASAEPKARGDSASVESGSICVLIAKKPKVQILGGDLMIGRSFTGSQSISGTTTSVTQKPITSPGQGTVFGSWVEYGIFATGTINGTGSGAAFAGVGGTSAQKCAYSKLSFVNAGSAPSGTSLPTACSNTTTIGQYSTARNLPDIGNNFPVRRGITAVYNDANLTPQGLYTSNDHGTPVVSDPITLGARTIARGQWVVINAPGADVTINGNLVYDNGPFQSVSDLPQLIIIAKNIYITPNVTRIDAWLVARGSTAANTGILDTCAISTSYATQLTINACRNVLTVNGPVIAQKIWLRRTGGEVTPSLRGEPAEIFNLRPDAYLWLYTRASTSGRIQSVYTRELPPRF